MELENVSDEFLVEVATVLKAMADVSRLKIMRCLHSGESNVTQITKQTGLSQANVSKHLKTLSDAGIVKSRRDGLQIHYAIISPTLKKLCETVCLETSRVLQSRTRILEKMTAHSENKRRTK